MIDGIHCIQFHLQHEYLLNFFVFQQKIIIYPEGTRSYCNKLLPFKKGAFYLALYTQCPIQPIVVSRYKYYDYESKKFDLFYSGSVIVEFLPEISTKNYKNEKNDVNALCDMIQNIMQDKFDQLNKETASKNLLIERNNLKQPMVLY